MYSRWKSGLVDIYFDSSLKEWLTNKKEMKFSINWGSGIKFPYMVITVADLIYAVKFFCEYSVSQQWELQIS